MHKDYVDILASAARAFYERSIDYYTCHVPVKPLGRADLIEMERIYNMRSKALEDVILDRTLRNSETLCTSTSYSYSRDLARFKPGDIVRLRQPYFRLSCGDETMQCYDTLTPLQIVSVDYGYATLKTRDDRTLTISVDEIEHYRKEEPMGTDRVTTEIRYIPLPQYEFYTPKRIIRNHSAKGDFTIVFWKDGTKTIVKRAEGEADNTYTAFTAALAKKLFGNNSKLSRTIDNCTEEQIIKPKKEKV